jgi:hypothetical protein
VDWIKRFGIGKNEEFLWKWRRIFGFNKNTQCSDQTNNVQLLNKFMYHGVSFLLMNSDALPQRDPRFIIIFIKACHWTLYWDYCIHSTPYFSTILFNNILPSTLRPPKWSLPLMFSEQYPACIFHFPLKCATFPAHIILLNLITQQYYAKSRPYRYYSSLTIQLLVMELEQKSARFVTKYVLTYNEPCQLSVLCGIISNSNELTAGVDCPLGVLRQMSACICT